MIMISGLIQYLKVVMLMSVLVTVMNCSDQFDDGIPQAIFDETINLNNIEYDDLQFAGGHVFYAAGVRGVVIVRQSTDAFLVLERNCTFQPLNADAIVDIDASRLFLIDHSCESTFDFDGFPIGGPASIPLRVYFNKRTGDFLRISSDPIG